jgi:integrase
MTQTRGKIRQDDVERNGNVYTRFILDLGKDDHGKRVRKSFKTREDAEAEQKRQAKFQEKIGRAAKKLTDKQVRDAVEAIGILSGCTSLRDAADFYTTHHSPDGSGVTCRDMLNKYIERAVTAERRPATIEDIKNFLNAWADAFADVPVANLTPHMLEKWHAKQNGNATTRNKRRRHLVGVLNYAVKLKYRKDNPATAIETANQKKPRPHVLSIEDTRAVMAYAVENCPEMIPFLALTAWAGVRPDGEMSRLTWEDIDFKRREIFISDEVSKTNDERYIPMADNLVAWLLPYRGQSGPIFWTRHMFDKVRRESGIDYKPDCFRHTFGAYHLARQGNTHVTAEVMGHRQVGTLFKHYRRAVRAEDAAKFWAIRPKAADSVVVFPLPVNGWHWNGQRLPT